MTKPTPKTIFPLAVQFILDLPLVNFLFNLISIRSLNLNISFSTSPLLSKTKQSNDEVTSFSSSNEKPINGGLS